MPVRFYMDVHVPHAITEQLRLRGADVLAATEEGTTQLTDDELLRLASSLGRVVFTHDHRFRAMAGQWQREGLQFAGLIFGPAEGASIGQYVRDLELISKTSDQSEWENVVTWLPL
ncbi:MAG: hypothetical protein C5B50_12125 [Verrucomicrobia bacterium]|nr:MAG: hypothetical protein C5B50_12125 [Verrucomicrobiota bacterium]